MITCNKCGASLADDTRFCTECGNKIEEAPVGMKEVEAPQPAPAPAPVPQPVYRQPVQPQPPKTDAKPEGKYALISTGGFIGITLLMCIPLLGQLLLIIWALGGCKKKQKTYYARACLILMIISIALGALIGFAAKKLVTNFINNVKEELNIDSGDDEESSAVSSILGLVAGVSNQTSGNSDSWPKALPKPDAGEEKQISGYRTEFHGTKKSDMTDYIEVLQDEGFEYEDFMDFGYTEDEMLDMNGWWGTDGEWYLSVSYDDGVITVDYTTDRP